MRTLETPKPSSPAAPTNTSTAAPAPAPAPASFLLPAGSDDVRAAELARELLRWPTILFLPASISILTAVGYHHPIAALPCGVLLATTAVITAARRASARVVAKRDQAQLVASLIPSPRAKS